MKNAHPLPIRIYNAIILRHPLKVISCLFLLLAFFGYMARDFRLDASADTLVLQNDRDLQYARMIGSRYGHTDYLFLAFVPPHDLFSEKSQQQMARLAADLSRVEGVASVVSLLDLPLIESPPVPVKDLIGNIQTLTSPTVDRDLARLEFQNSPLYRNLFVSADLDVAALQINLVNDPQYEKFIQRRTELQNKSAAGRLSDPEKNELSALRHQIDQLRDQRRKKRHEMIVAIRAILDDYRRDVDLYLGGVGMIADDLISFIKNDLKVFGIGVLLFLIATLAVIFRKLQWIVLPMLCCACSVLSMIGLLGWFGWEVTVISSNFISLQLIITMAIAIHFVVRYRELNRKHPSLTQRELVLETVRLKFKPCLFAALTTIAGFGSLVLCDILPVINFGWMMIGGIIVSLILTFLIMPAGLMLIRKEEVKSGRQTCAVITGVLARLTAAKGSLILLLSLGLFIFSLFGISRLEVENSFIDYFKKSTEIYRGMKVIDDKLGGTTPLDVVIDLAKADPSAPQSLSSAPEAASSSFDEFEEFEQAEDEAKYWFTAEKMSLIVAIHNYLDQVPETGKVLSLGTFIKIAQKINDGKPLDNFMLALLYSEIPEKFRDIIIKPYVSVDHNQVRFSVRIRDSEKSLKRNELLERIGRDLVGQFSLKPEQVHLTGLLVLYNNMLQSLFDSQILTLGLTLTALLLMFLILFRSYRVALIALFPNLVSITIVLGMMGWLGIPLDMMTITIAAISIGIAVDDSIHYLHRFIQEYEIDRDYLAAMFRCHGSIGNAIYYTSITVIMGFSILTLSNFIPSIYFGLLTGLAMLIALTATLTLLPQLLMLIKPFNAASNH